MESIFWRITISPLYLLYLIVVLVEWNLLFDDVMEWVVRHQWREILSCECMFRRVDAMKYVRKIMNHRWMNFTEANLWKKSVVIIIVSKEWTCLFHRHEHKWTIVSLPLSHYLQKNNRSNHSSSILFPFSSLFFSWLSSDIWSLLESKVSPSFDIQSDCFGYLFL